MGSQAVVYLSGRPTVMKQANLPRFLKRLGSNRLTRLLFKPSHVTEDDPYLLILAASQALDEGREEQAVCLIDAAYECFDQRANVTRLRPVDRKLNIVPRQTAISLSTV
jgi:hypothetical protein